MKNCTKKGTSQSIDLTTLYQTQLSKDLESLAKKQKIHLQDKEQLMLKLIQNTTDNLSEDDDDPNDSLSIKPLFKQSIWKTRFTLPFLKYIENSQNLITLITELLILADGHFNSGFISYIEIKKLNRFQGYFVFTQKNISLSFEVGTVIVPNKKASRINHVMTFIDIKFERKSFEELYDSTQQYHNSLKFDRQQLCSFKDIKLEQQIIVQKKDRTQYQELFLFVFVINWPDLQFFKVQRNSNIKWIPNVFIDTKLHVGNDILAIEHNYNQIRIKNQIFLNQFMDFTKATSIIDLLTETQEFNFKISEQEREVIRTKNNSITIGRSGTGKTICQVLRIFTIQTFYILKMHISDLQEENILINTYQKGAIGLRCVFTTMNPVLVGEVRKYYQKLQNIIQIRQSAQDQILLMIMQDISQYKPYKNLQNQRFNNLVDQVEIDNIQKISDLKENHFPAFLTIQKLLIMIDGSLKKPFFKHDQFQKDFKRTGRAGWDDGQSINISQEVKSMNSFGQSLLDCSNLSIQSISKTSTSNKNIQIIQVDYQYFKTRFWPSAKKMHAYTEDNTGFMNLVWTQIYSIIKGSQYSHTYPDNAIPKCIYLRENKDIYEQSTLNTIYDYYLLYEQWKKEKQLFDQMDLVNYLMNQIDAGDYVGTPIHYLTVDEIQDLPHALIELLSKITEQSLQLCGDTAQNIVQGVGFRFQDLKNNFKNQIQAGETKFLKFDFYQLTVNFRAHNNLLQLANNVVSLLEIFFPKSIDRLHKEVSSSSGPKPYVIESQDEKELISFLGKLFNNKQNKQNKQNEQIEFGCNQVILVKNDQTQKKVPKQLQDALILTVQESKGLEFDDVILYNFFTDDALSCEKWNIINHLFIEEEVLSTSESNQNNLEGCNLTCFQGSEGILIRKLRTKPSFKALDITFYNELCAELKMLYVAVTRSRQRLIIFDSDTSRRVVISDLWKGLGLIDTKLVIVANPSENTSIEQSSREEWAKTGENMFNNKYYEQAAKCFKMAKKETEQIKSQAFADATKAQQLQQEYENENLNKKGYNKGKNDMKENYIQGFISAAINFDKIQMIKHSADCYFSAQDYKNSLIQYIKCQSWIEAAESAEIDKKWLISGILYLKTESYEEGLKNIEKTENYLHVMSALLISRLYLPENQLKEKLCEYFPKVLKHLESELKDNGNEEQQMRLCLNQIKVISENCQNYKNEFDEIVSQFENSPIVMINQEALFKQMNSYVQQLFYIFLDIIQNENIQYDVERYINSMQQDDDNQDKINFIIDILQYFNQKNLLKIYFSFYQLKNVEKLIISEIFEDKLIYQLQICNNYIQITNQIQRKLLSPRDIQKAEQTARDSIQDISIILQHQEKDVRINFNFNLLVLGFYKQFKYQLVQWINNQLINGKANTQDLFEACFLFRNFEPPFDSNIHILTSEEKELLKLINQQKLKNIKFNLLKFQKNIKDIDDRSSIVYSDNQYIAKAFYLIKLIYQCVEGNIDLFNSLINLNQRDAQKFIFFTKLCSKIFEYNTLIPHQRQIFLAMCLQFGIGIPISSSFQNLGQSFIFFNQDSFFNTSDEYKIDISECYFLSFDGKTTIISTQLILKQLKLFFKRFHDNYSNTYIKIQEKANSQYLINLYALVKKKNKPKTYIQTQSFLKILRIHFFWKLHYPNQLRIKHFKLLLQMMNLKKKLLLFMQLKL